MDLEALSYIEISFKMRHYSYVHGSTLKIVLIIISFKLLCILNFISNLHVIEFVVL